MGPPILDRDCLCARVFNERQMTLIGPTYHRPLERPSAARSLRRARRATLGLALLTLALGTAAAALGTPRAGASTLVIEGAGYGHGVGMSQEGAEGFAQHGWSYGAILAHYYTGTTLGQAPAKSVVRVLVGGRVRRVRLERYVRGVVAAEMPASWPAAALEAQAVASRTYALTAHAGGSRFDVYSDTRSQVYRGEAAETAATNAAVSATAGQIVLYAGKPAITYVFASSGGMTESVQNGFPGAEPEPWLVGVADPYDTGPATKWKLELGFAIAGRLLGGLFKGAFRGIEVLKRGVSPRIVQARVLGSRASSIATGTELAGRLGLNSTWAYFFTRNGATVTPEPDHSGQSRTTSPSAVPTPAPVGEGGGVPAARTSSVSVGSSGGTPSG
jgi:SpoIID/LytB domain protein